MALLAITEEEEAAVALVAETITVETEVAAVLVALEVPMLVKLAAVRLVAQQAVVVAEAETTTVALAQQILVTEMQVLEEQEPKLWAAVLLVQPVELAQKTAV